MSKLIHNMIDSECPIIYEGRWPSREWRWLENINTWSLSECQAIIIQAQTKFGRKNVAMGDPFNPIKRKPKPDRSYMMVGIYVRDVDDLVEELMKVIDIDPREWPVQDDRQ